AMVGFPSDKSAAHDFKDTDAWPLQKFAWKDLFAQRGGTCWYEIVPMIGEPGKLQPDLSRALRANSVRLQAQRGDCSGVFHRGIISTQAIARKLPKSKGEAPSSGALKEHIQKPGDSIRSRLMGDLGRGVMTLIDRAEKDGGECYCALYELADKELIDHLKSLG